MNFDHVLIISSPDKRKLLDYGFSTAGKTAGGSCSADSLTMEKLVAGGAFKACIAISESHLDVDCYDVATNEKYALLDVSRSNGAFVNSVRNEIKDLIADIRKKCFDGRDIVSEYKTFLSENLKAQGDFPWDDNTYDVHDYEVFRCKNNKWFALVMAIPFKRLGLKSEEVIHVVNLKADKDKIPELIDKRTIFPAYHMNKKNWITVILSDRIGFEELCRLTKESKDLVEAKK